MGLTVRLPTDQYRFLIAMRYLNACEELCRGLQKQQGDNDFHFLVTLRSFIEYNRRGIWFLAWASNDKVERGEDFTFKEAGSPPLQEIDAMINAALGLGKVSPLMNPVQGVGEPFLQFLHALTHGNPIAVRLQPMGIAKMFDTQKLLVRAELDTDVFRILLYRRIAGEPIAKIWGVLSSIHNRPDDIKANVLIAADVISRSGAMDKFHGELSE